MSGDTFRVEGSKTLKGVIEPQGAKNEALQILCAVMLTADKVTVSNVPEILDVMLLIDLLKGLGVKVEKLEPNTYTFQADEIDLAFWSSDEYLFKARKIRGSVMLLGSMLSRWGKAFIPRPGGDKIGRRRLDTHFLGFERMGATFRYDDQNGNFYIDASNMSGSYILMDEISVTGTGNIIMAAVMTKGITTIFNAACEPYIQQLCKMLNSMGARIHGLGSNLLTIEGVERLGGTHHRCLPDMIEIGSFIGLAAMTESEITIKNAKPDHLGNILTTFTRMGIEFHIQGEDIYIPAQDQYAIQSFIDGSILTVYDSPWPGFTPDLMSIIVVLATQAKGSLLVHQKMFESRLFFVDKLIDMGAQIILCDPHRATIIGLNKSQKLKGIEMTSPDIRAGVALLIAALSANGTSIIHNVHQIDRGYQYIDQRLNALGASIERF